MNVKQLIEWLEQFSDDQDVIVAVGPSMETLLRVGTSYTNLESEELDK